MFAKSLVLSLALAAASVNAGLYVSTPAELKQCEEATFEVSGAIGSIWPFVVNPATPCDDPYLELDDTTGPLKWTPNLPVGTTVMIAIEDENGNEAYSGAITIKPGSSSDCVTSQPSPAASSSSHTSSHAATPSSTKDSGVNILNTPDTPQNAAPNPDTTPTGGATRVIAASGATVLTILSALALAL